MVRMAGKSVMQTVLNCTSSVKEMEHLRLGEGLQMYWLVYFLSIKGVREKQLKEVNFKQMHEHKDTMSIKLKWGESGIDR